MSNSKPPSHAPPPPRPLYKQQSWSPDTLREDAWQRRKSNHVAGGLSRHRLSKSLSEDDLEELKACIELGFGFDSPDIDPKLSDTIPALEFYQAVNKQYNHSLSRSSSTSSMASDSDAGTPKNLFDQGDDLDAKKTRLKQWAQVVACAVRQQSSTCAHTPDSLN
ncbi:DUF1685 family protein [Senna tora]|uniref:DUF1685 family protein n=1 Tax=Senna tora TaxID=362788 RepID=A0A835CFH1_9FABA|nr:DUF1685 family protein [Senna tora]